MTIVSSTANQRRGDDMDRSRADIPEFSRKVSADSIGAAEQRREVSAEPAEREALARRFGLIALDRLSASVKLARHAGDVIGISGRLVADVVQSCVVSLAPVPAHVETDFTVSYSAAASGRAAVELDPTADDGPEPLIDGEIDLGDTIAQELAIALDPYPRAPGAAVPPVAANPLDGRTDRKRPFSALEGLKKRR